MKKTLFLLLFLMQGFVQAQEDPTVLLAILARNKAHVLPHFLSCIDALDYDKKKISVYINTNNNVDDTAAILENWAHTHINEYQQILFEKHEVPTLSSDKPHEWTPNRFKVLGAIREKSLQKAKELHSDYYFVVDCDNFITPCTLKELIEQKKPIIAPMLRAMPYPKDLYSNFFCDVTKTGYYKDHADYEPILYRKMQGTFKVPVVHCTYLIQTPYIDKLRYLDETNDYEFVIFSRSARENGVDQYICNEKDFGSLLHFQDTITLQEEIAAVEDLFKN